MLLQMRTGGCWSGEYKNSGEHEQVLTMYADSRVQLDCAENGTEPDLCDRAYVFSMCTANHHPEIPPF